MISNYDGLGLCFQSRQWTWKWRNNRREVDWWTWNLSQCREALYNTDGSLTQAHLTAPPPLLLTRCPHRAPKLSRPPPGSQIAVFTAPGHGNQGDSHKIPIPGATPQIYHGIIGEFITELWNTRFLSQTTYILHFVGLEIHLRTSSRLQMLNFITPWRKTISGNFSWGFSFYGCLLTSNKGHLPFLTFKAANIS